MTNPLSRNSSNTHRRNNSSWGSKDWGIKFSRFTTAANNAGRALLSRSSSNVKDDKNDTANTTETVPENAPLHRVPDVHSQMHRFE